MAIAVKNVPEPVFQPPTTYTLTLTEEEAETLLGVVGSIAGTDRKRKITDKVYDALYKVGVRNSANRYRIFGDNNSYPKFEGDNG